MKYKLIGNFLLLISMSFLYTMNDLIPIYKTKSHFSEQYELFLHNGDSVIARCYADILLTKKYNSFVGFKFAHIANNDDHKEVFMFLKSLYKRGMSVVDKGALC